MAITRNDFRSFIEENIFKCKKNVVCSESISEFVLCCWVSPFGTLEKRVGYFEDWFESSEFYKKLLDEYEDVSRVMITNSNADTFSKYEWED